MIQKFLPTLKHVILAIIASTLLIATIILIFDATGKSTFDVGVLNLMVDMGDANMEDTTKEVVFEKIIGAIIAGLILTTLPIFLVVVFGFMGFMLALILVLVLVLVVIALAISPIMMALPLLLVVGLIYLLRRKKLRKESID